MIGRTLAHYRITAAIGAGGMGQVYRATDTKLGRDVALKMLPTEMASSPEMLERFRREARAVAALNHAHIVTIYSVEEADGVHFLTMELVEGQSLDQLIPEGGLEVQRILEIATALAEALAAAHEKGIVHRDLKPANVMLTKDGSVKVLDFGLAKVKGPEATGSDSELSTQMQTHKGVVMGTRPYMSPEQLQGRELDHRTDIFSLGVVLYEMTTGRRPFQGQSSADLFASILRDTAPPVTDVRGDLPADLARVIRRCLEKDPRHRVQTARDIGNELRESARPASSSAPIEPTRVALGEGSGPTGADEGFRVAVLPFKYSGTNADLKALAEGMSEEIVTGLSRFSYLRVIARSSTSPYGSRAVDVRTVAKEIGARYVMEGSLRQAGSQLRVAVQLVDAVTGAHLWAETYNRPFDPNAIFALQDDLVPRIVSTCADSFGVLARSISDAVRGKQSGRLSPYEALMRGFGYHHRLTPGEHAEAREALERAVERAPTNADCWAMLSWIYSHEHAHGFNVRPGSLERALAAARRAVDIAPSNHLAHQALAVVLFFRKETAGCLSAAERAMALNPLDGSNEAIFLITFTGDWERGCALIRRAMELNPHHPGWYRLVLSINEYRKASYHGAVDEAVKANAPDVFWTNTVLAAAHGQLGELTAARNALKDLLAQKEDFAQSAGPLMGKWFDSQLVGHLMEGLRKAGLEVPAATEAAAPTPLAAGGDADSRPSEKGRDTAVAIAVLPFSDMSPAKDQEYLCEGMAEEIMNALVGIDGIRVAARISAFRARQQGKDLPEIARLLSVGQVLEGSVRTSGSRLRVTAQLTDVASGYQLWSERFDRDAADVFAVQDEIAAGVVEAVKARLAPGERTVHARPQARNLEAYTHYLKGRHLRYTKNDHGAALRSFEQAVALDPSHAPSWVGLAEVKVLAASYGLVPAGNAYTAAREALATATASQGESAEALYVLGMIAFVERSWVASERALLRARELEPDNVRALCWWGVVRSTLARADEAMPVLQRARDVDPLAPYPHAMTGFCLLLTGRAQEAERHFDQALAFDGENTLALWGSGLALTAQGRLGDGVAQLERALTPSHRGGFIHAALGWSLAVAGRVDDARAVLGEMRARPTPAPAVVSEAWLLAALGDTTAAWEVLGRCEQENQGLLAFVRLSGFDPLRADPRFTALLRRLGLPAA